tara:strand:- start:22427 stop:22753 length:327 start_codon:yes stop_codon:yes gene_type:complete
MKKHNHCESRKGDLAEYYAITWLWDRGYEVFKNCGCTGAVDLMAMNSKGDIKLIDVKTLSGLESGGDVLKNCRTEDQKNLKVQILGYNAETRKLRFIKHKEGQHNDKA